MKFTFAFIIIVMVLDNIICQETNMNIKSMSGKTEEFWTQYFSNKKNKGKYEGFYIEEENYVAKSGEHNNKSSQKIIIVEINKYNYILLSSGNHIFNDVVKNDNKFEMFTIKGRRIKEPEDVRVNDPIYYNFWGSFFDFTTFETFNAHTVPCVFDIKGAKMPYMSTLQYQVSIGQIKGDKLLYNVEDKFSKRELILTKIFSEKEKKESYTNSVEWRSNGTGFLLDSTGYMATNYHVINEANEIEIEINSMKYQAKVIVSDKTNDLAILKIDLNKNDMVQKSLPYSIKTEVVDVGTSVFTLGYPFALNGMGKEIKFTDGKISSKTGLEGDITQYQISVPIQGGNSGGPLFDENGNIIGITGSKIINQDIDNVGYAIKVSYLMNLIDLLPDKINHGTNSIIGLPLTAKVKVISPYIGLIKTK